MLKFTSVADRFAMASDKIKSAAIKVMLRRIMMILLFLFIAYFSGLIYFIYFWDGGWGKSIV